MLFRLLPGWSSGVNDLDDVKKLRKDKEAMWWFIEHVVSFVVGRKKYKENIMRRPLREWITVSDEALGMVLLENSWIPWTKRKRGQDNVGLPKFSMQILAKGGMRHSWSDEGYKCYNLWMKTCHTDRDLDGEEFDDWVLEQHKGKKKDRKVTGAKKTNEVVPVCYFSDDEENSDEGR